MAKRKINGKIYESTGSKPTSKSVADSWARFNRQVNNLDVVVIKVKGGYQPYVRRRAASEKKNIYAGKVVVAAPTKEKAQRKLQVKETKDIRFGPVKKTRISPVMKRLPR